MATGTRLRPTTPSGPLHKGKNVFAVRLTNQGGVGGLLVEARVRLASGKLLRVVADETWKMVAKAPDGWQKPDFDDKDWGKVELAGKPPVRPWGDVPGLPADPLAGESVWYRFKLPSGARGVPIRAATVTERPVRGGTTPWPLRNRRGWGVGRSPRPPLFRFRSVAEAWLGCPLKVTPAQPATRPRAPKLPPWQSWGEAGGPEARRRVAQRRGWGGGEPPPTPQWENREKPTWPG